MRKKSAARACFHHSSLRLSALRRRTLAFSPNSPLCRSNQISFGLEPRRKKAATRGSREIQRGAMRPKKKQCLSLRSAAVDEGSASKGPSAALRHESRSWARGGLRCRRAALWAIHRARAGDGEARKASRRTLSSSRSKSEPSLAPEREQCSQERPLSSTAVIRVTRTQKRYLRGDSAEVTAEEGCALRARSVCSATTTIGDGRRCRRRRRRRSPPSLIPRRNIYLVVGAQVRGVRLDKLLGRDVPDVAALSHGEWKRRAKGDETKKGGAQAECGGCLRKESEERRKSTCFSISFSRTLSLSLALSLFVNPRPSLAKAPAAPEGNQKRQPQHRWCVHYLRREERERERESGSAKPRRSFAPPKVYFCFLFFSLSLPSSASPALFRPSPPFSFSLASPPPHFTQSSEEKTPARRKLRSLLRLLLLRRRARPPLLTPALPAPPRKKRGRWPLRQRRLLSSSRRLRPPTRSSQQQRPPPKPWRGGLSRKRFVCFFHCAFSLSSSSSSSFSHLSFSFLPLPSRSSRRPSPRSRPPGPQWSRPLPSPQQQRGETPRPPTRGGN